jgi:hypothetical protein
MAQWYPYPWAPIPLIKDPISSLTVSKSQPEHEKQKDRNLNTIT